MAKKKKKKWSGADYFDEFSPGGSAARDIEESRRDAQTRGHTSVGFDTRKRYNTGIDTETYKPMATSAYQKYVASAFSGRSQPGLRLSARDLQSKNYRDTARLYKAMGGKGSLMNKQQFTNAFKKDVDKRYSLKRIVENANRLNLDNTRDLIRRSYNDINAVRELGNTRRDVENLLKDIDNYKNAYGNSKDIDTASNYVQQISQMIKKQAKGGSAVSNKVAREWKAPLAKPFYDTKTKTKADVRREYELLNEMNMRENFGDLNYKAIKNTKGKTPAEKEWLKERRWQLGTKKQLKKDYADANEEIYNLQQERESLDEPNAKQKEISQKYGSNTGLSPKGQQLYKQEEERKEERKKQIDARLKELSEFSNRYRKEIEIPEEMAHFNSKELPGLPNKVDSKEIADIIATKSKYNDDEREYLKGMLLQRDDALDTYKYIEGKLNAYKQKEYGVNDDTKEFDRDNYTRYRSLQIDLARKIAPELIDKISNDLFSESEINNWGEGYSGGYTETEDVKKKYKNELSKFGERLGNDIFEAAKRGTEEEVAQIDIERAKQQGEDNPILTIPKGAISRNTGGLGTFFENIGRLNEFNTDESKLDPVDYYSDSARTLKEGEAYQEGGLQAIDNDTLKKLYQAVNSGADMGLATIEAAPLLAIPGVGSKLTQDAVMFIMGTQAGASAMIEAHEQGADDRQALQYGLVSGLNETAGEKLSLDVIFNAFSGKARTLKNFLTGGLKGFIAEGSEEVVTDLLNRTYDNMVNNEDSLYNKEIQEYMKQGLTKKAATQKADDKIFSQLGDSFTVGGLAGLMFGMGVGSVSYINSAIDDSKNKEVGGILNENLSDEDIDYMTKVGMKSSIPEINEQAYEIQNKLNNGQEISNKEIGELSRNIIAANEGIDLEDTDIKTNEITSQIAEKGAESNLPKKVIQSMVDNYDGSISPAKYANGFIEFYTMGKDTQIDSWEEAMEKIPSLRQVANEITPQAAGVAFSEGNNPRVEEIVLPQTKPKGRVVADFDVTPEDNLYVETLKRQAKLTGLDIVVTDDISKYTNQKNAQGAAFISGGKVVLDKDTANILGTADHEILGHFGKALAPKSYKKLANIVSSIYREDLGIRKYDEFVSQLAQEHNTDEEGAQEEAIAYGLETLMLNPEVAKKSITKIYDSSMTKAEKQHIVSKLLEFVRHIIDNLKERIKNANVRTGTESMLKEDLDASKIAEAKLKVYEEIRTNLENLTESKGETSEAKYSLTEEQQNISKQYNKAVADNDTEQAAKLVEQYAKTKGYDTKVYHGTKQFGFTQIDLDQSDDGMTFWATDSLETATTYSDRENVRRINETYKKEDLEKLNTSQLDNLIFTPDSKFEVVEKNDINRRNEILNNSFNKFFDRAKERKRDTHDKVIEVKELYNNWKNNKSNLNAIKEYAKNNRYSTIDSGWIVDKAHGNLLNKVNQLFDNNNKLFYDNEYDVLYDYDKEELIRRLSEEYQPFGNYEFYANTEDFNVIDAKGKNWSRIEYNEPITSKNAIEELFKQDNPDVIECEYVQGENVYVVTYDDMGETYEQEIDADKMEANFKKDTHNLKSRQLAIISRAEGYEGLLIRNVKDHGGSKYDDIAPADVYIFFNPVEQVKSADPITYDDNGNVIPLEERFSKDHDDIRYSMANEGRSLSDVRTSLKEEVTDRDIERFKALKEDLGNVLRITKGSKLDTQATRQLALQLKKNWNVKYDTNVMTDELKTIGRLIETKGINNSDTTDYIKAFVTDVLKSEAVVDDNTKDFINFINKQRVYLSQRDREQITDYNEFRKSAMGSMRLTTSHEGALAVDELYEHIKDNFPEYYSTIFDEQYPDSSDLPQLLEWIKTAREGTNLLDMYGDEALDFYVQDVIGAYTNAKVEDITNSKAKRNKLYKDVGEMVETIEGLNKTKDIANQNLIDQMRKMQSDINQKLDRQRENITNQYEQKMKDIESKLEKEKSENVKRIKAIKEKQKERERRQADSRRRTQQRQVIRRTRDRVKTTINKPTIHKFIPIPLLKATKDLFNSIDLGEQFTTARLNKMRDNAMIKYTGERLDQELAKIDEKEYAFNENLKAFRNTLDSYVKGQLKNASGEAITTQGDADTYYKPILNMIDNTIEKVGNTSLMKMDLDQLKEVSKTLRAIEKATTERQRPQTIKLTDENGNELDNYDKIARLAISQAKPLGKIAKGLTSHLSGRNTLLAMGGYNPNSIVHQLADQIDNAYIVENKVKQELNGKWDKTLNEKKGKTDFTMKSEEVQRYKDDDLVDVGFKDVEGKPILLNHDSLIWEYLNLESDDNLTHAARGGISFPDYKKLYARKSNKQVYSDKTRRTANIDTELKEIQKDIDRAFEDEDYNKVEELAKNKANILEGRKNELRQIRRNIEKHLTDYDKKVIKTWREIRDTSTDMLNDYWLKTFGFENFNEENYWRIVTNPNFIQGSEGGNLQQVITNLSESGSTIARLEGAGNPIISGSALFAVDDYINNTAKLIAYSGLQRDLNAVMKYTLPGYNNLQQTIQDNAPKLSDNFVTFQQALFGGLPQGEGSRFIQTTRGLAARSTLSPNLRVALAQVPSYLGTYRYTDGQAVANAWLPKNRVKQAIIDKYTPLMYARGAGGYSLETSDLKQDTNKFLRTLNKIDRAAKGWIFQIPNKMDTWTVRHTFGAYLDYARRHYNLEEGTQEQIENGESPLYKKAAELFNEGTMRTQPMFNAFNKNILQLSQSELKKTLTIFHTQPFQYLNLAMQDIMEYKYEVETNGKNSYKAKKARTKALKSLAAILSGTALFTLIKIGVDKTIRHKKDEVEPEDVAEQYISSLANMFVLGSTITDGIYSLIKGKNIYDFEIYGTQIINSLIDFAEATAGVIDGKNVDYLKHIVNILSNLGIPVANIEKDLGGIFRNVQDYVDNGMRDYSNEMTDKELLQEYILGDKSKDDLKELGIEVNDKIKFGNAVKKLYEDGEIDGKTAEKVMTDSGLYDDSDRKQDTDSYIKGKVERWNINSYKDEYLSTLTKNGAPTKETNKVIAKIAKQPYENAFYSDTSHSHYKNYKSPYEKLLNHIKKWHKTEQ